MTQSRRYHRPQQNARQRRLQKARERLQLEQARAQRSLQALEQAIRELGLPETVVEEVEWRLQAQGKRLGKIFGVMFPPFLAVAPPMSGVGCAAWDKPWPARMLGALPKRKWVKHVQQLGRGLLVRVWQHIEEKSPATRSRWQWTWVADDRVFKQSGQQLGLVGTW